MKNLTFTEKETKQLYYNEEPNDNDERTEGPKGYEGWWIETDTDSGDFDSEKGSMHDYDINLFDDNGEFMGSTTGGYFNAIAGEHFYGSHTFSPPAKRTKEDDFNDFLMEVAESHETLKKKVNKVKKHLETI